MKQADIDYASRFPAEYEAGHTAGLRLLRVAARAREDHGPDAVARLYSALCGRIFDSEPADGIEASGLDRRGTREFLEHALAEACLPAALEDESLDAVLAAETEQALGLTGKDVGTPIIHFQPPEGVAFLGPVISRPPREDEAAELWDHGVGLARFPGFAELKRSLRELPRLRGSAWTRRRRNAGGLARRKPAHQEIGRRLKTAQTPADARPPGRPLR